MKVVLAEGGIHDMKGALVALDALLDEWEEHPITLVRRSEERADVPRRLQPRPG
jgi:hypothetical protein